MIETQNKFKEENLINSEENHSANYSNNINILYWIIYI